MEQFKRAQIIMLPNIDGILYKSPNGNPNFNGGLKLVSDFDKSHYRRIEGFNRAQHLYIISDDEIKEGDWFINLLDNSIHQATNWIYVSTCKKIIATTDTSLKLKVVDYNAKNQPKYNSIKETFTGKDKYKHINLPQPSQQFIEKYIESYNKGEVITDVLVEYEPTNLQHIKTNINFEYISNFNKEDFYINYNTLKINPKDNTITIKKVKDSWNREEVIKLCGLAWDESIQVNKFGKNRPFSNDKNSPSNFNKWIEENL